MGIIYNAELTARKHSHEQYADLLGEARRQGPLAVKEVGRRLSLGDLFFFLVYVLSRPDLDHDWLFERCREVQADPNGYLDLWAREHYKSTIITFALTIQDILYDPEITFGLFSVNRPSSKKFLYQIRYELETNRALYDLFPDILWENPNREAPRWSLDEGIIVKRKSNPKEATVEAHGLIDSMPTGRHFKIRLYDDVIDDKHVTNPEMIAKSIQAWELSLNLGSTQIAKRYGIPDIERYAGTRYHFNDPYAEMLRRKAAIPRVYPGTKNGQVNGEPVLWTKELMEKKRRKMGPYIFGCFAEGTKILMSDWTEKEVDQICTGDEVVGYRFGNGKRATLCRSKVLATSVRKMPVVRITFASGRQVICTEDHKFWTGRVERGYAPLSMGKKHYHLDAACSVYNPEILQIPHPTFEAGYLAAIIDGEGGVSGGTVHIHQCPETNPKVCERIEHSLNSCGLSWSLFQRSDKKSANDYYLTGGREQKIRLLNIIGETGKSQRIIEQLYKNGTRNIGKGTKDKVVLISSVGDADVYNIQTETGNYIAEGYAVKNCQILQNPKADEVQGFKKEWLKYWVPKSFQSMNVYIVCDPASSKKKTSDWTVMDVIGLASDQNYYWIDGIRDRLNLEERGDALFYFHRKYRPIGVGYEEYGMLSDIEHYEFRMKQENYRFEIVKMAGKISKEDRIKKLIPIFSAGRFYCPTALHKTTYEGQQVDLVVQFVDEEYTAFPVPYHDDGLDCKARILDEELNAIFPKPLQYMTGNINAPLAVATY